MLTPPEGLSDDALATAIGRAWGMTVASMSYCPVGFGSHHWEVVDADGVRSFVTVDELHLKRSSLGEPVSAAFHRLRAALRAAQDVRDGGCTFAVAPTSTLDGEPLTALGDRFGVAWYPYVEGDSFSWHDFVSATHRRAVLDLIVGLHTASPAASRRAPVDDYELPRRDELELSIGARDDVRDAGPYGGAMSALLTAHAETIQRLLIWYDDLAVGVRERPGQRVLTHGEPHPGNTMLTASGWVLVDWDTALVGPPERDLWTLDPGDGSMLRAYEVATGVVPDPLTLDFYRLRWDLADIAVYVSRFRARHARTADDEKSWEDLCELIEGLPAGPDT